MRAREAVEILEEVIVSGDGPATIGAQVARRAGIAASEVRGTYEGMWLLERSDQHAATAPDPGLELARNAAIRAEMHLDAGVLDQAEAEARRAIELDRDRSRRGCRDCARWSTSRSHVASSPRRARALSASTRCPRPPSRASSRCRCAP